MSVRCGHGPCTEVFYSREDHYDHDIVCPFRSDHVIERLEKELAAANKRALFWRESYERAKGISPGE